MLDMKSKIEVGTLVRYIGLTVCEAMPGETGVVCHVGPEHVGANIEVGFARHVARHWPAELEVLSAPLVAL